MSKSGDKPATGIGGKFVRFPVPEFERGRFKGMSWQAPEFLDAEAAAAIVRRGKSGDTSAFGCYPVMPADAFFDALGVKGEHRHAVLCVTPQAGVTVTGRSYAWFVQHAWIVDSLDAGSHKVLAGWKTPRPMNTLLGPKDGIVLPGGIAYAIVAHAHGGHWDGNRTILQNSEAMGDARTGFRILSASLDDGTNFHDCNLDFGWAS